MLITIEAHFVNDKVRRLWTKDVEIVCIPGGTKYTIEIPDLSGKLAVTFLMNTVAIPASIAAFRAPENPRLRGLGFLRVGKATRGTMQKMGWVARKWY